MEQKVLHGTIEDIIFQNIENGYAVFTVSSGETQTTCVGIVPHLHTGESVEISGNWTVHATYGKQFQVQSYEKSIPTTKEGIEKYLASGVIKGIGAKTAKKIVERFGEDSFYIIEEKTERLVLTWLFFIAVIVLLVVYAKKVDWEEVWKVIRDYNRVALLSAVGLVVVSYLIYGCYDLLARFYCGHKLAKRQVMLVSFICYAFNLTLSTWVGGIGMRYRLYSRLGLPGSTITRIFSLSITTNWLGYILLAGIIFTAGVVELPDHWYVDQTTLRILGIGLLMIIAVYLWFCAFAKHRHMTIKGQKLVLPSWKFALAQMLISSVNWMVMGAIIWLLLGQSVNYFFVLGVLLVSSIAGVIVHIPAGIGVLEAVFIALLAGEHTSKGSIIAALLAYRVLYYFIPLLLALICYLLLESQAKKLRAKNEAAM